jgi:hypothetical protein
MPDELSKEQQETYLMTLRARLERNEKGKVEWIPDLTGPFELVKLGTSLVRYFYPAYQPAIDPYGNLKEEAIVGFIHIKERKTGARAAFEQNRLLAQYQHLPDFLKSEEVEQTAKYYGAQIIKEKRLLQFRQFKPSLFRRILLFFTRIIKGR